MIDSFQFQVILALFCMVMFILIYSFKRRFDNFKELIYDSFLDGLTLFSGLILILFSVGKIFGISFLNQIDSVLLYFFIIFAGFIIIAGSLDKVNKKRSKNAK